MFFFDKHFKFPV